ncbi:putative acyl- N-acyltransferase [Rosellinia necatrix]|uniref:Putative acyl-N-acyltransferase n=1 Tax=Rosellinia necatrix TaxID=77044 RepID=A0A1W2TW73_ROSNE|nr:putative acyl- N-acyltransferase [Rosellinia necatrix]
MTSTAVAAAVAAAIPDNDDDRNAETETEIEVEVAHSPEDFVAGYRIVSEALGRQVGDPVWQASNPGWDTAEGQAAGARRMLHRSRTATADRDGNPNAVFLKASVPDPDAAPARGGPGPGPGCDRRRVIVGFALWIQSSTRPEHGTVHSGELRDAVDLEALLPGDGRAQAFLCQMYRCQVRPRLEFLRAKEEEAAAAATAEGGAGPSPPSPPVILVLGTCATHPSYQRRGVGTKLTRWGLDEARRRGVSDVTVEASAMGRRLYERLGFRPQGRDIVYETDEEFAGRGKPSNVFMVYSRNSS